LLRNALFLHIQKTAGTSVQEIARGVYGNSMVLSHDDYKKIDREECHSYKFISGHFDYSFARPLMVGRYSFTFLRNPIDRVISLYDFYLTRDPSQHELSSIAQKTDLEGFITDCHSLNHRLAVWNNQTWRLSTGGVSLAIDVLDRDCETSAQLLLSEAELNLQKFDYVGFVENFELDIKNIFLEIGCSLPALKWSNATKNRTRRSDLSKRVKSKLDEITQLDRQLYDGALKRYLSSARYDQVRKKEPSLLQRLLKR
jgi:Sulfotransferase family